MPAALMITASTGLSPSTFRAASSTAAATSSAVALTAGTKRTMTAATWGSASRCGSTVAYVPAVAPPSMSTGLATLASAGSTARRAETVSSPRGGRSRPAASQASAARIPSPPAFVISPTERPPRRDWLERSAATSISSSSVSARMTPAWWNSASAAASEPASAAVCELAARWPLFDVPLLSARIGLRRATLRAIRPKRRGFPNDST